MVADVGGDGGLLESGEERAEVLRRLRVDGGLELALLRALRILVALVQVPAPALTREGTRLDVSSVGALLVT